MKRGNRGERVRGGLKTTEGGEVCNWWAVEGDWAGMHAGAGDACGLLLPRIRAVAYQSWDQRYEIGSV